MTGTASLLQRPSAARLRSPSLLGSARPAWLPLAVITALTACVSEAAQAQARAQIVQDLDEVVVTGERGKGPVSAIGSRLGLTSRETPATIEVIDSETIRRQGFNTLVETVRSAAGVTAADTSQHTPFTMRGFQMAQVSTTYNGINLGSTDFTGNDMATFNLERVEFLKGPSSITSGQGSVGGTINFVTKAPLSGPAKNELFLGFDHRGSLRIGFDSGGTVGDSDVDYRLVISRFDEQSFIEDSHVEHTQVSGGLDYYISPAMKLFVAAEYKELSGELYEGTPLVPIAYSGEHSTTGIVHGNFISPFNGTNLGAITIDRRTLRTNYNILDDDKVIREWWLRGGLEWSPSENVQVRSHFYIYDAHRSWHNNEVLAFNAVTNLLDRERFFVQHDQRNYGNNTDVTWTTSAFGRENRMLLGIEYYNLDFVRPGAANFPRDSVSPIDPARGTYGLLTLSSQTAGIDSIALNLEDQLKLTPDFALVAGLRYNHFKVDRTSINVAGNMLAGFPFSKEFDPVTGRLGFTWDLVPDVTLYGQYATASDIAARSYFLLNPTQRLELSPARSYELGLKASLLNGRAQATLSAYEIERRNVYSAANNRSLNAAGTLDSQGIEATAEFRPVAGFRLWGNASYNRARYARYIPSETENFSGNTPPNIPTWIANAGGSYRFDDLQLPIEFGGTINHVGARFTTDDNSVTMDGYTIADIFAFMDLPKGLLSSESTRLTVRVKNVTDKQYAGYGDPFYPNQIFLGQPRTYEAGLSFRF